MDRTRSRTNRIGLCPIWQISLAVILVGVVAPLGCGYISLMMYNMNPDDTPAEFNGLKQKRVVVVCRPVVELQFADSTVPRDLVRQVNARLKQKVRKIDLVDDREVAQWIDEHSWQKFTEVGKAMKADLVIGIELDRFSLEQGPTLLQGNADVKVTVYDMNDGGRDVHEKALPRILYPPNTPIPSSEKSQADFRRQFIVVLAEQIGRQFYAHDSMDDFGIDANLQ